jgi:hypothetical protein
MDNSKRDTPSCSLCHQNQCVKNDLISMSVNEVKTLDNEN